METRLLKYFLTICEELNFTKAAEKLNISQPTLSQQIRILESYLETELFHRVGKKVYISQSGEVLRSHTKRIFNEIREAKNTIKEIQDSKIGRITVGCTGNYVHAAIALFHEQYPKVKFSLIDVSTKDIINNILSNQFDIGIIYLPINEPQLESKLLFKEEFTLVISSEHDLAKKEIIKIEDLQSIPLYLTPKNYYSRQNLNKLFEKASIRFKPLMELSDRYALLQMAIMKNGATILPTSFMKNINDPSVRQIPIDGTMPMNEIGLIYRKERVMTPIVKNFIDFLTNYYAAKNTVA